MFFIRWDYAHRVDFVWRKKERKKKDGPAKAKDMYISPLFKGAYRYAHKLSADKIFILSAKYGLLEEMDEPY